MATSGTTAYDRTGAQLCQRALKIIQVVAEDETITTNQQTDALEALNLLVKTEQTRMRLWRKVQARLFLVPAQAKYNLTGANACDISELSETTLDAAEATSQTVLSVAKTSNGAGFANADVIGIVLDDDTLHWTTISSFVTDDTVTIGTALPSAAASGNRVYAYTTAAPRALKITSCRRDNSGQELTMNSMDYDEYFDLPNKTSAGTPVNFMYDPQRGVGELYLWPTPDTVDDFINYSYLDGLEIFSAATDTSDFPEEWMEFLVYGLALRMAPQHGHTFSTENLAVYTKAEKTLLMFDQQDSSVVFTSVYR